MQNSRLWLLCISTALSTATSDFNFYKNTEIQKGNKLTLNPCLRNPRTEHTPASLKYCLNLALVVVVQKGRKRKKKRRKRKRKKERRKKNRANHLKEEEDKKGGGRQFGAGGRGRYVWKKGVPSLKTNFDF